MGPGKNRGILQNQTQISLLQNTRNRTKRSLLITNPFFNTKKNNTKMKSMMYAALIALTVLTSCTQKEKAAATDHTAAAVTTSRKFNINEHLSTIKWKGKAPDVQHTGAFAVSGSLQTDNKGNINSGHFTIPIASITNFDLSNPDVRNQLLNHLKSPDFFDVALYPNASFRITAVRPYTGTDTGANTLIVGEFTMIGQTHSIEIPANIKMEQEKMTAEGHFIIDRLKWGMSHYSDPKANLYIFPEVEISLHLLLDAAQ
jgi:polyisoprenoid-binding protein YceI